MKGNIWLVFDIDGVITDGCVYIGKRGEEQKRLNMKDIDAVYELAKQGYSLAVVTSENNDFTEWVKDRFPWKQFYSGVKNKSTAIKKLREDNQIEKGCLIYIGDGKKDLCAFESADYRICPQDAIEDIRDAADLILSQPSGTGVLWELIKLIDNLFIKPSEPVNDLLMWQETLGEHLVLAKTLHQDTHCCKMIIDIANIIINAIHSKKRILLLGNGGSAADAQHIAAEFMGRFQKERNAWDVEALTVNTSLLTAIANDYSYEEVFSRQIQAIVKPKDVVIGISTSGFSRNVLFALHTAKKLGGITVLMTGRNGSCKDADVVLNVPSNNAARIQEMHILIGHFLAQYAEVRISK